MNEVDGVVLVVIQITDDRAPGTSAFNTRMEQRRLLLLDPARGEERLMEIQQHDGVVVEHRQRFAKRRPDEAVELRSNGRERGAKGFVCPLGEPPPFYI